MIGNDNNRQGEVMLNIKQRICIIMLILAIPLSDYTASAASFNDVTPSYWANSYIDWAVDSGLAQGYKDGSFRPDDKVTEIEFLAMMLRAYGSVTRKDELASDWSRSYYNHAERLGWPVTFNNQRGQFNRGQAALLIAAAANGKSYNRDEAIQWLLDSGISQGRSSATIAGYEAGGGVKRAEALTFVYMMKEKVAALSDKRIQKSSSASLNGISIGENIGELLYRMGQPTRIDASEYDYEWYVYNSDYAAYSMYGVRNGTIAALFSNDEGGWRDTGGANVDIKLAAISASLPASVKAAAKKADHYYDYRSGGIRHTLFLDSHEDNRVAALLLQSDNFTARQISSFGEKERTAMEQGMFDMVNAERAQRSIDLLQWDKLAGSSSRAHSIDMMKNNYFSHTNKSGKSPFDRMKSVGIAYTKAAENLAAGSPNSIFAHYMLLNSESHRENLLNNQYTRLGVGVAFGGSYGTYFTQNFYTP
ncbi:hypothetical protein B1748_35030 [Paenibacillus sp. MY03]|nr:hypothetical protein B1748_35030 [Paenibacillus sp. MY03]